MKKNFLIKITCQDHQIGQDGDFIPNEIEFWLDGEGRIHERLNYIKKNGKWRKKDALSLKRSIETKTS